MRKVIVGAQGRSGRPLSGAVVANGFVFVSGQSYAEGKDAQEFEKFGTDRRLVFADAIQVDR